MLAKTNGQSLNEHNDALLKFLESYKAAMTLLPNVSGLPNFWRLLEIAIIFHDLGKCASGFQKLMLGGKKSYNFRHEWLSGSILLDYDMPSYEKELVLNSILSHHKNFTALKQIYKRCQSTKRMLDDGDDVDLEENPIFENEIKTLDFEWIKSYLAKLEIYVENFTQKDPLNFEKPLPKIFRKWITEKGKQNISNQEKWQNILLSASLSICDHNASANLSKILILQEQNFRFLNKILKPFKHQTDSWKRKGNVLLIAPTGQGKTESALGWLRQNIMNRQGRAFYLLPFTASINAMVGRISKDFGNDEPVGVLHAKVKFFIDEFYEKKAWQTIDELIGLNKKIYKPFKIATPYQILKWAFGVKGFEKGLTELVGSYIIVDEIHVYNNETYENTLFFLRWLIENLQVRVFIMSATLPTFVQKQMSSQLSADIIKPENRLLVSIKRHRIALIDAAIEEKIFKYIGDKKLKILIVCNTVVKAQMLYDLLDTDDKVMLHSRFNALDRTRIENEIIRNKPRILIGTQAIEVSLDIDYDLILSEIAPIDSLLQRFGRVYRKRTLNSSKPNCYVFTKIEDAFKKIYTEQNVLENTVAELKKYDGDMIDEAKIQLMLDNIYAPREVDQSRKVKFFNMLDELYPYDVYEENEAKFDSQFDGIEVLPYDLEAVFNECVSKNNFLEAQKLFVPVSKQKFWQYKNNGYIIDKGYIKMVALEYNSECGLIENSSNNFL